MKQKTVIFDLDDTLVVTHPVFVRFIQNIAGSLSKKIAVDSEVLVNNIDIGISSAYSKVYVDPNRLWPMVFDYLEVTLPSINPYRQEFVDSIMEIYSTPLELFPDTLHVLNQLRNSQMNLAIVTHASADWVDFKLETTGIKKYFDCVEIADPGVPKTSASWANAASKLGINPEDAISVGDNIKGDMQASHEAGFKRKLWLDRKNGWSTYRTGDLPEGTEVISSLTEILHKI